MKLKRFKERDHKRKGIIVFTIACILLVSGVILYQTFAIFEVKTNQNVINGNVQGMGDIEFAFYKDDTLVKEVPKKEEGYSLDTSSSYCIDLLNDAQVSNVNWDYENWEVRLKNVSTTKTKCYLHFKQIYQEEELNGAIPDLGNGRLIPVQIKEEQPTGVTVQNMNGSYGGKVVKADITSKWYSYKDKEWANAVILRDGKSDNYSPGDEILESDIESYFVWIPRYRYKLFAENPNQFTTASSLGHVTNNSNVPNHTPNIEIVFETKAAGITNDDSYMTHPAFTSFNSNGLWVGKFETGYEGAIDSSSALVDNVQTNKIIIKPNVYSWRGIQVANAFYNSYDYQRELNSHMMKNSEWGVVAYLASSKYGLCDENNCVDIHRNNNSRFITGYAANAESNCGYTSSNEECNQWEAPYISHNGTTSYNYFDMRSKVASTTGNYSGIYDMSGGSWEYVMGVLECSSENSQPATGPNATNNSGFNDPYSNDSSNGSKTNGKEWPSSKYYDLYEYSNSTEQYQRGHFGDGTKEFGPFQTVQYYRNSANDYGSTRYISSYYADAAYFINSVNPWFARGGTWAAGSESGIMGFIYYSGKAESNNTFRVVLTP